jgi:hypothetical protein
LQGLSELLDASCGRTEFPAELDQLFDGDLHARILLQSRFYGVKLWRYEV